MSRYAGGNSTLARTTPAHGCGGADGRVVWPGAVELLPGAVALGAGVATGAAGAAGCIAALFTCCAGAAAD
ncbi:MAG TPA: hypothetical protein VIM40_11285 [Arthrobacter sp.]